METQYVHVKWKRSGADDMVPEHSARLLAEAGDLIIVEPTPGRHRRFKARVPLGRGRTARNRPITEPAPTGASDEPVTEPAPVLGASTAEEATE